MKQRQVFGKRSWLLTILFFENFALAGYFTSRPASKGWIREATAYLQAARQLEVFTKPQGKAPYKEANGTSDDSSKKPHGPNTNSLEEAVSLLQHHDAITGTEKQHVTDDYHIRLAQGMAGICLVSCQQPVIQPGAVLQVLPLKDSLATADFYPKIMYENNSKTRSTPKICGPQEQTDGLQYKSVTLKLVIYAISDDTQWMVWIKELIEFSFRNKISENIDAAGGTLRGFCW